jgi:3-oxoacyl-[acyl-carrier-protein] synthase II
LRQGNICISTACSSGTHSIGYGYQMIRSGRSDLVVAGGADTMSSFTYAGFGILRVVDPDVTRPFSKNRNGLNLGEAAAILTLESLRHAKARGAKIYAEIIGYGTNCDAYHMTAPGPEGSGAAMAMNLALRSARIDHTQIDYINAHGTGTKFNDLYESMAIKKVFGPLSGKIPVSSTKSMTGHTLGAAGSLEAISAIFSIQNQYIHPTINHEEFDEKCGLYVVPNEGRHAKVEIVMSNSFGFGGNNAVLILKKFNEAHG